MERLQPNSTGITVFDHAVNGGKLYQQYKKLQWLRDYQLVVDNFKQEIYFNKLAEMWDQIDVAESEHEYLTFYTKWLFGIYRPLSGASLAEYYDTGRSYDTGQIYDDAVKANGLITAEQYLKYIKFIIEYSQPTWTIDYILRWVADYCDININEIRVDYSNKNEIKVILPNSDVTNEFVKVELNYRDEMGLPFGNVISFEVDLTGEKPKRHLLYSPYNGVFNKYANDKLFKNSDYPIAYRKDDLLFNQTEKNAMISIDYRNDEVFTIIDRKTDFAVSYKDDDVFINTEKTDCCNAVYKANELFAKKIDENTDGLILNI